MKTFRGQTERGTHGLDKALSLCVAAGLSALALACVMPVLVMLVRVFVSDGGFSLAHFRAAYSDPGRLVHLMRNSAAVAAGSVLVALALGVPAGFLCFRTDIPLRRLMILGWIVCACMPVYVTATAWLALFGMRFWQGNLLGAAWIQGAAYAPLAVLITGICFLSTDREQEETALLDTGPWGLFRSVCLPQAAWAAGVSAAVVALLTMSDITVTDILCIRTFAEETFTQFQLGAQPERAVAISVPLIVVIVALFLAAARGLRSLGESPVGGAMQRPDPFRLGGMRLVCAAPALLIFAVCCVAPLAALVRSAGSFGAFLTSIRTCGRELVWTLKVVPAAACLCVALAVPIAGAMARSKWAGWCAGGLVALLVALPAPVVGIAIIELLNHPVMPGWLYGSEAGVIAVYVVRTLPFAILALWPWVRLIPDEIHDAFDLAGGDWLRRLAFVTAPLCWRGIVVAWLLVFVLCLAEIGASVLVVPPGRTTLTIRFFSLIHYGVYPDAAGLCLLLFVAVLAAAGAVAGLLWPGLRRRLG